jgi:glucose 1-dehydrogenase
VSNALEQQYQRVLDINLKSAFFGTQIAAKQMIAQGGGRIFDITSVGPGAVATPINTSTMKDPTLLKKLDDAISVGRMAQPEEIASVVAFLAGPGASYLTATTIFADGGIMHSSPGL